jgi:type IV secretion system protein VirB10
MVLRGNKRVNIIWSRVIRPDGIDIMIRSPGADQLGTAGVPGNVDNKYLEIFSSAFLVSAINIAMGFATYEIDKDQYEETTNTDGSTSRSTDPKQEAALRAIDLFGDAGTNLVDGFLNLKPTITIDQGTRVNVFVNRDLVFPAGMSSSVTVIQ